MVRALKDLEPFGWIVTARTEDGNEYGLLWLDEGYVFPPVAADRARRYACRRAP